MTLETGGTFYRDIDIAIGFNLNYFFTGVFVSWFQGIVSIVAIVIWIYKIFYLNEMEELLINKVTYEWVPLYDPTDYDLNSSKTETYV